MIDRRFHIEPLQFRLLPGDDHIHVMPAAQTMIRHREQAIRVRRQIHANHVSFLVHYVIDESRVLMGEAVVVLPPHVRCQQIIQRRDRTPPLNVCVYLQPLGMLIEHRIHDVNESLVAGKETVTAGKQISFEPALAHVLAQDFDHAAVAGQIFVDWKNRFQPLFFVASYNNSSRFDAVSSGPKTRKFFDSRLSFITSRRNPPSTRVDSASAVPGVGTSTAYLRKSGMTQIVQQDSAIRVRIGAHPAIAFRSESGEFRINLPFWSNNSSGR